jgi:hypothetical protein
MYLCSMSGAGDVVVCSMLGGGEVDCGSVVVALGCLFELFDVTRDVTSTTALARICCSLSRQHISPSTHA